MHVKVNRYDLHIVLIVGFLLISLALKMIGVFCEVLDKFEVIYTATQRVPSITLTTDYSRG